MVKFKFTSGVLLFSLLTFAQTSPPTKPRLSFEVASIKIASEPIVQAVPRRTAGRIHWTTTFHYLVEYAYRVPRWRLAGEISSKEIYIIDATLDPAASDDQVRAMFRSLLEDRFKMTSHRAQKEATGYALSVVRKGSKIQAVHSDDPAAPLPEWFRERRAKSSDLEGNVVWSREDGFLAVTGRRASIRQLCDALEPIVESFVVDETGMQGVYYFALRFAPENASVETQVPSLFRAIQEDLGLKLEKKRGSIEMLVVDRIASVPTEN